jgi:hypothetical protein
VLLKQKNFQGAMLYNYLNSFALLFGAILVSRFAELPANFTPLLASAIFIPQMMSNRLTQVLFPISILFLSDIVLGFYTVMPIVYLCMGLAPIISSFNKNIYVSGTLSVLVWHIAVNGAVYVTGHGYPPFSAEAMIFDMRLLLSTILFLALFDGVKRITSNIKYLTSQ